MDITCFYLVQFTLMDLKSDNCAQEKPANGQKTRGPEGPKALT